MNESDVKQWFDRLMSAETVSTKEAIDFISFCVNKIAEINRKPKRDTSNSAPYIGFFGKENATPEWFHDMITSAPAREKND
jgi:hypothetical protein